MKSKNLTLLTAAFFLASSASIASADKGDKIERHLDRKGDRIERHLDRKGDRIENRFDNKADHARVAGKYGLANRLERKGNIADNRLDRHGKRIDRSLDRKGQRINRRY